jgi:NAD(P)-dependent dehydrogenase (short-subunit alcohol dehydrogenase family)
MTAARELSGKTALITGATQGIGRETAFALAHKGARVGIVGRDRVRTEAVAAAIRAQAVGAQVDVFVADLSLLQATRRLADEVKQRYPRLDVLVNNAGAVFGKREVTPEGIERTLALNHLSYFVLTRALLPLLESSAPARIVSVASNAHRGGHLDFDDLQAKRSYSGFRVYSSSKLANVLFTRELSRRLVERGVQVTANCLHPGVIASGFGRNNGGVLGLLIRAAAPFMTTPEKGARTTVYLASAPEVAGVTGQYFKNQRVTRPSRAAEDGGAARRLWDESEKLVAAALPA